MQKELQRKYYKLLNIDEIVKKTPDHNKLKVKLKWNKIKGIGLFAKENIKKGEIISFYKIRVFNYDNYKSPTKNIYLFDVYDKKENTLNNLIGDIDLTSFPDPIDNIPFWAPFANESLEESSNAEIDINTEFNYKDKKKIKVGDSLIYNLIAKKNIKKGEEITWYYGEEYKRNYELK